MSLRTVPIHKSLHRVNTFMGGDREVLMVAALIAGSSIFLGQSVSSLIAGIVLWIGILIPARIINKADPLMRHVFLADLHFKQRYYPAKSHVLANPNIKLKTKLKKYGFCYK